MAKSIEEKTKDNFILAPNEAYMSFNFGELKFGEKYIKLPTPLNIQGNKGFMETYEIYEKIRPEKGGDSLYFNSKRVHDQTLIIENITSLVLKVK